MADQETFKILSLDGGGSKNRWYKPLVRIFKNASRRLVRDGALSPSVAPSYFIECLLYNVPTDKFGTSYQSSYRSILEWLNTADLDKFTCQNGLIGLFGDTKQQWSTADATMLIDALIEQWNKWTGSTVLSAFRV